MNQRIKELMDQAMVSDGREGLAGPHMVLDPEKFANLLIKDCVSICEINGTNYKHSFTPVKARVAESTSNHCGELIKRHFGVK